METTKVSFQKKYDKWITHALMGITVVVCITIIGLAINYFVYGVVGFPPA